MKMSREEYMSNLEDVTFKYERLEAQLEILWHMFSDGIVEITGVAKNSIDYFLYELDESLCENNKNLQKLLDSHYN